MCTDVKHLLGGGYSRNVVVIGLLKVEVNIVGMQYGIYLSFTARYSPGFNASLSKLRYFSLA